MKTKQQPILISQIEVPERLRELDTDHVAELKADIEKRGLLDAIWVREQGKGKYRLLAGEHRLEAVIDTGAKMIRADIWEKSSKPEIDQHDDRIMEIVENLMRKALSYAEEADQAAELMDAEQAKEKLALASEGSAKSRRTKDPKIAPKGVAEKVAKETGQGKRSIQNKASQGRALRAAAENAGVEKTSLVSAVSTQKDVEAVAKLVRTPVADTHKRKDGAERDRKTAVQAIAEGVKATAVVKDWTNEYFESSKPKASNLDPVVKLLSEARAKHQDAAEQLRVLGHGPKANDLEKVLAQLAKLEADIKAAAKHEKEGTSGDPETPSNFTAPKSKREQSEELALTHCPMRRKTRHR